MLSVLGKEAGRVTSELSRRQAVGALLGTVPFSAAVRWNTNLWSVTDANNHSTTFPYDADNRPANITRANGVASHYAYDAVSNLLSITREPSCTATRDHSSLCGWPRATRG